MRLKFTKMQGAGNDFVVVDGVSRAVEITPERARRIADRHFGVGCDQVLLVEKPRSKDADFRYRIWNADGGEVEQCGNGARCFVRFVHDKGLTKKNEIRVETLSGIIVPRLEADGQVTVDMGKPLSDPERVPFDVRGLQPVLGGKRWRDPVTEKPVLDTVEIWELVNYTGDTHPIHYDVEYCRARGMPNLLAHGFQTLVHTAPGAGLFPYLVEQSLVGFLEQSSKFLKPVFAGDTLYPALDVTELVPGRSTGVVTLRSTVFNQRRELVLEGMQKFLIRRRPA